jgi:hypothetical protein
MKLSWLIVAMVIASVVTFGLNSYGIVQYEGMGNMLATLPYRIGVLFVKVPMEIYVIHHLYHRVVVKELILQEA